MPLMPGMSAVHYPPALAIALFYRALAALSLGVALLLVLLRYGFRVGRGGLDEERLKDPTWRALSYGLGFLWLLDGFLQAQPLMVTRFVGGVIEPLLHAQPHPVAVIVRLGATVWSQSPIWLNAGACDLQSLIGLFLLFGRKPLTLRLALWMAVVWGLVVWVFGEALGGIFVGAGPFPGTPGSALLAAVLALMLLGPRDWWREEARRRVIPIFFAVFFLVTAFFAAWPADGWWTGPALGDWARAMADMSQPAVLASILLAWSGTLRAHPALWNGILTASSALLASGWTLRPQSRFLLSGTFVWTSALWFLGQDFGFIGGMGTDPNTGAILLLLALVWVGRLRRRPSAHLTPVPHTG